MITRNYKDYQIVIYKIESNLGKGYRAAYSIPKSNGLRENVRSVESYRPGVKASDMLEGVKALIDSHLF